MVIATGSGEFRKLFAVTSSFTFPVGDTSGTDEYSPVTLNFIGGTFSSAYAGVRLVNAKHPSNGSSTDYLKRYWTVTQNGISGFSCNADFVYADEDIVGIESNITLGKWDGLNWINYGAGNTAINKFSAVGVTSFSDFTGGQLGSLPVQLVSFVGSFVGTNSVKLEWQTVSEINNYGFNIQKLDPTSHLFETIGFEAGKGATLETQSYSFIDEKVSESLEYRLEQLDNNGLKNYFGPIIINPNGVINIGVPVVFRLNQNYPNPFNPTTSIAFSLSNPGFTTLKVYNLIGVEISTLFSQYAESGKKYSVKFDATKIVSGIYFYKLQNGKDVDVKKMLLVK
jgi:hypothetical protein